MNDATAKITSGVLNGNINQFGDFDECLNVEAPDGDFQGKYCLAYLQPTVSKSLKYTNYLRKLMSSFEAFRTTLDDVSQLSLHEIKSNLSFFTIFSRYFTVIDFSRVGRSSLTENHTNLSQTLENLIAHNS